MIEAQDFNKRLLMAEVSVKEFARISGRKLATVNKFSKSDVPNKDEHEIDQLLTRAERPIFFGEQITLKDI